MLVSCFWRNLVEAEKTPMVEVAVEMTNGVRVFSQPFLVQVHMSHERKTNYISDVAHLNL